MGPKMVRPRDERGFLHASGISTPRSPRLYDYGDFRDVRCYHPEHSSQARGQARREMPLPESFRQNHSPDSNFRRPHAPRDRGKEFGFRTPLTKRNPDKNHPIHTRQFFQKLPSGAPDNSLEEITYKNWSSRQSPFPVTRLVSPRLADTTVPNRGQRQFGAGRLFHESITQGISQASRKPRGRPVPEREPTRHRSGPGRTVEINHHGADGSRGRRMGHGSPRDQLPKVDRREAKGRNRRGPEAPRQGLYRRFGRESLHVRNFSGEAMADKHDITRGGSTHLRKSAAMKEGLQPHAVPRQRGRETPINHVSRDAARYRPQIIQDGNRQLSEIGARVCMGGRERRHHGTLSARFQGI